MMRRNRNFSTSLLSYDALYSIGKVQAVDRRLAPLMASELVLDYEYQERWSSFNSLGKVQQRPGTPPGLNKPNVCATFRPLRLSYHLSAKTPTCLFLAQMEMTGFEPVASAVQRRRSPN